MAREIRSTTRALAIGLLLAACSSRPPATDTGGSASQAAPARAAYAPITKPPPAARRATPPLPLAANALAVGAVAPAISLADTDGRRWTLGEALAKHARVMLVFYRGDW